MNTDDDNNYRTALQFKELADISFQNRKLSDANFFYVNCIKAHPEFKNELKSNYLVVLNCLGQWLEKRKQYSELFTIYEEALLLYNESEEIHHNMGAHLLRLGCADKASFYFQEALKRNNNFFPAYRSLHVSYCAMIERWHFRMLNDAYRNAAYKEAIRKKVLQGFTTVLDIGTGTGLFCLYALEAGAHKIYACDYKSVMVSIASTVFEKNSVSNKIKLMFEHSNSLEVPENLSEKVSLVVTETMDCCIIGEQMISTLKYAWEHLLLPPYEFENDKPVMNVNNNGIVIPHSGSLYVSAVQSELLAKNYMYPTGDLDADNCLSFLANISLQDDCALENFKRISLADIEVFNGCDDEPYDTERLQNFPDLLFLTEPQPLFYINFNDPQHVEEFLNSTERTIEMICIQSGILHAIVAWFKVNLDETVILCSSPKDKNSQSCCWDQAIFYMNKAYNVVVGCKLYLKLKCQDGKISFQLICISYPTGMVFYSLLPIPVSASYISMLNDNNLLESLKNTAIGYIKKIGKPKYLKILDCYPIPIFGLSVLNNAHLLGIPASCIALFYVARKNYDKDLVHLIARNNDISMGYNIESIPDYAFEEHLLGFEEGFFDVILVDFLNFQGDINEDIVCCIDTLKSLLKEDGLFLPNKINLHGQLIFSDYIEKNMRVVDSDLHHYNVAQSINEFEVSQMLELKLATLSYEKYSDIFVCHQFDIEDLKAEFVKHLTVNVTKKGTVNAVLYWFSTTFLDDRNYYSSLYSHSYINQAAFITKSPLKFNENVNAIVELICHHGQFIISVRHCNS